MKSKTQTFKNDPPKELEGWHIEYNPKPIPDRRFDYDFWHDEYDGDNGLAGNASSTPDALNQIKEIMDERMKSTEQEIDEAVKNGIISSSFEPLKCDGCGSTRFDDENVDFVEGIVCEVKRDCADCGKEAGYWAYGSWQCQY